MTNCCLIIITLGEEMKTSRRIFVIANNIWERVMIISERDGITASEVVRRAIIEFLDRDDRKRVDPTVVKE